MGVTATARTAGVSVRTLQFYDRTGLLPAGRDATGRRCYDETHLVRLQRILLLTGAGCTLAQVTETLDRTPDQPLVAVLDERVRQLELRELVARGQRRVLTGLTEVLRRHPGAHVPAAAVGAMTDLGATLLDLPGPPADPESALSEAQVQHVLATYFTWKTWAVQALVLLENGLGPTSPSGLRLGADQVRTHRALVVDAPDVLALHVRGEADAAAWPPADRDLHHATKEFLAACADAHLARPPRTDDEDAGDGSPSSASSGPP